MISSAASRIRRSDQDEIVKGQRGDPFREAVGKALDENAALDEHEPEADPRAEQICDRRVILRIESQRVAQLRPLANSVRGFAAAIGSLAPGRKAWSSRAS